MVGVASPISNSLTGMDTSHEANLHVCVFLKGLLAKPETPATLGSVP